MGEELGKGRDQSGGGLASVNLWRLAECGYGKPHKTIQHGPEILTGQL